VYLYPSYLCWIEWIPATRALSNGVSAGSRRAEEVRSLLKAGLVDQNILDLPEDQRPELINDRGRPDESQADPAAV